MPNKSMPLSRPSSLAGASLLLIAAGLGTAEAVPVAPVAAVPAGAGQVACKGSTPDPIGGTGARTTTPPTAAVGTSRRAAVEREETRTGRVKSGRRGNDEVRSVKPYNDDVGHTQLHGGQTVPVSDKS